jgi:hypothetical protein
VKRNEENPRKDNTHTQTFHCSWLVKGNEIFPFVLRSKLQGIFKCIQLNLRKTALPPTLFILASNSELNTTVNRVQNYSKIGCIKGKFIPVQAAEALRVARC